MCTTYFPFSHNFFNQLFSLLWRLESRRYIQCVKKFCLALHWKLEIQNQKRMQSGFTIRFFKSLHVTGYLNWSLASFGRHQTFVWELNIALSSNIMYMCVCMYACTCFISTLTFRSIIIYVFIVHVYTYNTNTYRHTQKVCRNVLWTLQLLS